MFVFKISISMLFGNSKRSVEKRSKRIFVLLENYKMTDSPEDYIGPASPKDIKVKEEKTDQRDEPERIEELEIKQESLAILASLGTTKEYLGVDMSLGDVKKLSVKDIEKYYNRYQAVLGKKISGGLVDSSLQLVSQVISYVVPVDDIEALCSDLKNDDLVNRELTNIVGLLALKAGRLAALASGVFQVAKHVKFNKNQQVASAITDNANTTEQATKKDANRY